MAEFEAEAGTTSHEKGNAIDRSRTFPLDDVVFRVALLSLTCGRNHDGWPASVSLRKP
jgi:hypothetical protein